MQEEAENERMHMMTFLQLKKPGPIFRGAVILTQWVFTAMFSFTYLFSPNYCHR
jgi:threonyl-tRNA synthetase